MDIADIGYVFCVSYIAYCIFFYLLIIPTSMAPIKKTIDYINLESENINLYDEDINNLCISSRVNTLKCFEKNMSNGQIDKYYNGDSIIKFDRIYYFNSFYKEDKQQTNKSLLMSIHIFVSDRFKIIAPVQIAKIYNDYFYKNNGNKINYSISW